MIPFTPLNLVQFICSAEFKSLQARMLPSIPDRTRRSLMTGKNIPTQKTIDRIEEDLSKTCKISKIEIHNLLTSPSQQPWKKVLEEFKKLAGQKYCPEFEYATHIIIQIEKTPFQAARLNIRDNESLHKMYIKAGLPSEIIPLSFIKTSIELAQRKKKIKNNRIAVSQYIGKLHLRTSLYLLAAFETSLVHSKLASNHELWVQKLIPYYNESKLVNPMRLYFQIIMENLKIQSITKLATKLCSQSEIDIENQRREIQRWVSGKQFPSWKTVQRISNTLFEGDRRVLLLYGVARFLQSLLNEFQKSYIPTLFAAEEELAAVFQEYPRWQKLHQKNFKKWDKARSKR